MKILTLLALSLCASISFGQTAPADSTKPKQVVYELRNPRAFIPAEKPNPFGTAGIDPVKHFGAAKPVGVAADLKSTHVSNLTQLTFAGENLEPSFSHDGKYIYFSARNTEYISCSQVFRVSLDGKDVRHVTPGRGRASSPSVSPKGARFAYSSTINAINGNCPPNPDTTAGRNPSLQGIYELYIGDTSGNILHQLTSDNRFFDGQPRISPDNQKVLFTSTRSGDIDLFTLDVARKELLQLTVDEGYDGEAQFSPDGSKIVFIATRPRGDEIKEYRTHLIGGSLPLASTHLMIMDTSGANPKVLILNGAINTHPVFTPDGKGIVFASNLHDKSGKDFDLYRVDIDGKNLQAVVSSPFIEDSPAFSPDGTKLSFTSNRNATGADMNIFVADWK